MWDTQPVDGGLLLSFLSGVIVAAAGTLVGVWLDD